MAFKTLSDMDLAGKKVLIRVDLNVPVDGGRITDDTRIRRVLPTIEAVLESGGKPILLSHFGRPKGKRVPEMSLGIVTNLLAALSGRDVRFEDDCIGIDAESAANFLGDGEILLLENTRFYPGEETNDSGFAQGLAAVGDVYVNDAFSAAHRAHASTEGIARLLPSCAGLNMQAELDALQKALGAPERPVTAVVGGAKVSTKLDLIGNLLPLCDAIVIGGGMANTFLAAQGHKVGKSLCEYEMLDTARDVMARAASETCKLILPVDVIAAEAFAAHAPHVVVPADECPDDKMILDVGPASVTAIKAQFATSKTLLWNGPLGAFEIEPFNAATDAAATEAARLTASGALLSVAGGGDTVSALNGSGAGAQFTYVSTAGGAFLEWLEGKTLPGVAALATA